MKTVTHVAMPVAFEMKTVSNEMNPVALVMKSISLAMKAVTHAVVARHTCDDDRVK
jgi:hypothetical protein